MKKLWAIIAIVVSSMAALTFAQEPDSTTVTQLGQVAPDFQVTTLQGESFHLHDLRGKVVWLNFFATWCPSCKAEMPELETQVWQRYKGEDFAVVSIGREQTPEELVPFTEEIGLTFPVAPDPDRTIYGLYATLYIPRNVLVDREGKIAYQSRGYTPEEFKIILAKLDELLKN